VDLRASTFPFFVVNTLDTFFNSIIIVSSYQDGKTALCELGRCSY
jgi:hypothetical protein